MELSDATEKTPASPGIDPGTFRLVAQCLNHYATPGPTYVTVVDVNRVYSSKKVVFDGVPVRFLNTDITTRFQVPNLMFCFFYNNTFWLTSDSSTYVDLL
jgi:hypothetical protein